MASTSAALRPKPSNKLRGASGLAAAGLYHSFVTPQALPGLSRRSDSPGWEILSAGVSLYSMLRPLLFGCDPERAHGLAIAALRLTQALPGATSLLTRRCLAADPALRQTLFGLEFPNPLGLAAGFDKDAVVVDAMAALGFGFVEVGTVTLRPQPGNPRPRLFRYPGQRAIINRMGFNNDGAEAIAERLAAWRSPVPVFVNIGKNREVTLDAAADAYAACAARLTPYADTVVVN